jgi:hypothetical protein
MGGEDFKSLGRCKIIAAIREPDPIGSSGIGFFAGLHTSTLRVGCIVPVSPSRRILEPLTSLFVAGHSDRADAA